MAETFLEEIKEELVTNRSKKRCCQTAELRALLIFGAVPYEGGALFGTESFQLARRVSFLLRKTCTINLPEKVDESAEGYKFLVPGEVIKELFLKTDRGFIEEEKGCEEHECCKRAFLRGAFLAAGSASNPEKAYRAEVFSENEAAVKKIGEILDFFQVEAGRTKRKKLYVAYANKCEAEADMLKAAEAGNAVFRVLEARVIKDRRNETNRITNCDMANSDRAADTSFRQRAAIEKIEASDGLDSLKPKLREAAVLRMENPEASICELAAIAGISKSAMHHRLESIISIASEK